MKVFIDTSVFISYFLKHDILNIETIEKFNFYKKQNAISEMQESRAIKVFYIDKFICRKAEKVLIKFSEHKISFTDATTYVLYKDFALDEVFTLDSDFKKIGVNTAFK